jgi:hypothetical protein
MDYRPSTTRKREHRASVRLHVMPDPEDPLLFLVTSEPVDGDAIPVIPTARAHSHWVRTSLNIDGHDAKPEFGAPSLRHAVSRAHHPSHVDDSSRAGDRTRFVP